jgi:hypothetical protein
MAALHTGGEVPDFILINRIIKKHCLLVDTEKTIEYAREAASEKMKQPAKTAKNLHRAPHNRTIKITEDPTNIL